VVSWPVYMYTVYLPLALKHSNTIGFSISWLFKKHVVLWEWEKTNSISTTLLQKAWFRSSGMWFFITGSVVADVLENDSIFIVKRQASFFSHLATLQNIWFNCPLGYCAPVLKFQCSNCWHCNKQSVLTNSLYWQTVSTDKQGDLWLSVLTPGAL
jgi:hypothetical protein